MTSRRDDYNYLPEGLPEPKDDGACDHLLGMNMPAVNLISTKGRLVDPSRQTTKYTVIFVYPMTGSPFNKELLEYAEEWNAVPGACGCTTQVCGYRDFISEFNKLNVTVFGLSNNSQDYQKEAADRLEIDYELLSDEKMEFANPLKLSTLSWRKKNLLKRATLIFKDNKIVKVFYPIFPPNKDASEVLEWLRENINKGLITN